MAELDHIRHSRKRGILRSQPFLVIFLRAHFSSCALYQVVTPLSISVEELTHKVEELARLH